MQYERKGIEEQIYSLTAIDRKTVDALVDTITKNGSDVKEYSDIAANKISQFHRSDYSISDIEYMREKFDVPVTAKQVQKAVFKRGRNVMFKRLGVEENNNIDDLCRQYGVYEKVQKSKKTPVNAFLKWYNEIEQKYPLAANMAVSSMAFTVGDFIGKMITTGSYEFRDFAVMAPLAAYYAWEMPKLLGLVENTCPISSYNTSFKEWANPKLFVQNIKRAKGEIGRNIMMNGINIFGWVPRHFAVLEFKKEIPLDQVVHNLSTGDFYINGVEMSIAQLPITAALTHIVLNKMDLQYRFLAMGTVNVLFSAVASYISK